MAFRLEYGARECRYTPGHDCIYGGHYIIWFSMWTCFDIAPTDRGSWTFNYAACYALSAAGTLSDASVMLLAS